MRRLISSVLPTVCVAFLLSGCGLLLGGGSRQTILVQASPTGAKVTTSPPTGDYTAPTSLNLERKTNYVLNFSKEGYSPATFQIQSHVRGGIVVADVLLTGLIGVIIDAATGAWSKLSPEAATVSLTKIGMVPGPDTIYVGIKVGHTRDANRVDVQSSEPGVLVRVEPIKH
jgi:hypothetical protein